MIDSSRMWFMETNKLFGNIPIIVISFPAVFVFCKMNMFLFAKSFKHDY